MARNTQDGQGRRGESDQDSVDDLGEAVGVRDEQGGKTRDLLEIFETHAPGSEQETELEIDEENLAEEAEEEEEPPS